MNPVWRSILFVPANVDPFVDKAHTRGADALLLDLEDADAFAHMTEIARAERVAALGIGGEDFALSLGIEPTVEAMTMPKQHVVIAARAAGVIPLGLVGSIANFSDLDSYRAVVRRSRALGLAGSSEIHPDQGPEVNSEVTPT